MAAIPASKIQAPQNLRIVHIFRSPVGGIFRHVRDLVGEQVKAGHDVGIICDNNTGGTFEDTMFEALQPDLKLGLYRFPMSRSIGFGDVAAARKVLKILRPLNPDVLHAHGAKGGAYARLAGAQLRRSGNGAACLYTPHGGSMHYDPQSIKGRVFFLLERMMQRWTDKLLFVSAYERDAYFNKVGTPSCPHELVPNGVQEAEFAPVDLVEKPADFLFIGMMRDLKGVDLFIDAMNNLPDLTGKAVAAHLVGDGPDLERYVDMAGRGQKQTKMEFHPPMPARDAFRLAHCVVVPSRAESMPYLVLEALAAGKPMIATRVGGIPEIFGPQATTLVEPDNADALSKAMAEWIKTPGSRPESNILTQRIREKFSVKTMSQSILDAYRTCLSPS